MEELRNLHPNAYEYVINTGPHKWSRVHCPDRRVAQSMRHQLTDATHLVILKRVDKCNFMTVNPVDWNIFSVKRAGKQWTVDLARKTCTCNNFQMDLLPCSHALVAVRDRNMDFTSLCVDYYKRQTLIDAYSDPIMPVGYLSTWIVTSDITKRVILNPSSRRQTGRPRASRHISSSERTTTQNCRRCGQLGHNLRRCSNPALTNECPSRVIPEEYRCKCSICHTVGHNRQTCSTRDSTME
ncbi:hypothetical protein Ddye_012999 [Dipteronia dyeriana]|uniref:SWIM-type domain-containing protein n=1 Tax=Dipteronia dyeriana TaxID=168575 RepID=A0AAE0CJS0_9ROSI|nr:hypothetical protein Ddye_012999 [Dipteronia dyeriana]